VRESRTKLAHASVSVFGFMVDPIVAGGLKDAMRASSPRGRNPALFRVALFGSAPEETIGRGKR
jgi:hypothetical protein